MRAAFFTSDYVLDELYTICAYKAGGHGAKTAINLIKTAIKSNELTILEVDSPTFQQSEKLLLKFSGHRISFTDATAYCMFKNLSLDEIFTLDSDFKKMRIRTPF